MKFLHSDNSFIILRTSFIVVKLLIVYLFLYLFSRCFEYSFVTDQSYRNWRLWSISLILLAFVYISKPLHSRGMWWSQRAKIIAAYYQQEHLQSCLPFSRIHCGIKFFMWWHWSYLLLSHVQCTFTDYEVLFSPIRNAFVKAPKRTSL